MDGMLSQDEINALLSGMDTTAGGEGDAPAAEAPSDSSDIPVKAVLGKCNVSVNDFVHLQPGDIIRLDNRVNTDMQVYVGNIFKFTALPGTAKDKYAVRITSVIREEEE